MASKRGASRGEGSGKSKRKKRDDAEVPSADQPAPEPADEACDPGHSTQPATAITERREGMADIARRHKSGARTGIALGVFDESDVSKDLMARYVGKVPARKPDT